MIATSLRTSEGLTNEVRYMVLIFSYTCRTCRVTQFLLFFFNLQIWKDFTNANLYEVFSPDKSEKLREFLKDGLLLLDNR